MSTDLESMMGMSREDIMNKVMGEDLPENGETTDDDKTTVEIEAQPELEKVEVKPEASDDEAVILTKDGKHTIKFEEFRNLKDKVIGLSDQSALLMATIESQKALIQQLVEAKAIDKQAGNTEATEEVIDGLNLDDLDLDYPGIKANLLKIIAPLQEELKTIKEEKQKSDALQAQEVEKYSAKQAFDAAVMKIDPDYIKITAADNDKFWSWYNSEDRPVRIINDGQSGDPQRIANVLKTYKAETQATDGDTSGKAKGLTVEETAKKVADALKKADDGNMVQSLGDVPGGTNPVHDEIKATLGLSPMSMLSKFEGKTREQIEELISRANRAVR